MAINNYVLQGGWPFTPAVYDYAANHEAAKVLSWDKPRVILFPSFLSPMEVSHLVAGAKEHLVRSEVLAEDPTNVIDNVRTSFGAWPKWDKVIGRINSRIHRLMGIPLTFGESIYILNYQLGQQYAS
jgi:prolyl 4-hydroxylase